MGVWVQRLGFGVWDLGFRVSGSWFLVYGLWISVQGLGFRLKGDHRSVLLVPPEHPLPEGREVLPETEFY